MKYLLLLFTCSLSFASILTVNLDVRENYAPSRHANLSVSDGTNSLYVDLYLTPAYQGQITQLGYCVYASLCSFTPGGDLTATIPVPVGVPGNSLVLGGAPVPSSDWSDYSVWFSMDFTGGSPTSGAPWGPQTLDADLNIAITQLSSGICVLCAHAPFGTGTASGDASPFYSYPDYRFVYHASGEIVPEPGSWQIALMGIAALLAAGTLRRKYN